MRFLKHFNKQKNIQDNDILNNNKLLNTINNIESFQNLVEEWDLKIKNLNKDSINLETPNKDLELLIVFNKNSIVVKIDDKIWYKSSVVRFNHNIVEDEKFDYSVYFRCGMLNLIEAVWKYNMQNYFDSEPAKPTMFQQWAKSRKDFTNKITQNTGLDSSNLRMNDFKDPANKYHLLKNLLKEEPKHALYLKHLPKSIDVDDELKQVLKDLETESPGFI